MTLLHLDEHLAVVDKPAGLLVHQGWARAPEVAVTLARRVTGKFVYPVHRLDRAASGCLVFALSSEVARSLHEMFESGAVRKRYLAIVRGVPLASSGVIDHPIPSKEDGPRVPALTEWRLVSTGSVDGAKYSLVEALPRTGRLHQIRRHLKHLGHPIIGDVNYGQASHNRRFRALGVNRLLLHASEVRFRHPVSGAEIVVEARLPDEMRTVVETLGIGSV